MLLNIYTHIHVCVCACACACVRACVRACVCARALMSSKFAKKMFHQENRVNH